MTKEQKAKARAYAAYYREYAKAFYASALNKVRAYKKACAKKATRGEPHLPL